MSLGMHQQVATEKITSLSEEYRDVARRGSLLYFVITDLHKMNSLYVYSLNAFVAIFQVRCVGRYSRTTWYMVGRELQILAHSCWKNVASSNRYVHPLFLPVLILPVLDTHLLKPPCLPPSSAE